MREIQAQFNMISYKNFIMAHGYQDKGPVQAFFTQKIFEFSEPYTPKNIGIFETEVQVEKDFLYYYTPYANYLWEGKLFVDPITGKGAFYSPSWGFWSRPNTLKEKTNIDLNYNGAPMRGPKWIDRMWADKDEEIIMLTERYANRGDFSEY